MTSLSLSLSLSLSSSSSLKSQRTSLIYIALENPGTTVIHTHQSTCIQFIVFYAAQFDESLPSTFVGLLLDALANESLSEALRMTCVCYCASFVSRAKYIELGTVRSVLKMLEENFNRISPYHHYTLKSLRFVSLTEMSNTGTSSTLFSRLLASRLHREENKRYGL